MLRPACMRCQHEQARMLSMETKRAKRLGLADDLAAGDAEAVEFVQSVEWL